MIKNRFPIATSLPTIENPALTYEEVNAIRYSAEYIPLQRKIENSSQNLKEELILSLLELTEDDGMADESQDWITQRDGGGGLKACQYCNVYANHNHGDEIPSSFTGMTT